MSFPMRPVLSVAAVVIAIAGTAVFLRGPSGIGIPGASASAQPTSPTPSTTLPTSPPPSSSGAAQGSQAPTSWRRYTSDQYGFTVGHPSDWTVRKAFRPWSFEEDATDAQHSGGAEGFLSEDEYLYVNAWMAPLADGQSGPAWLAAFCPTCAAANTLSRPVQVDGQPGTLISGAAESQAFVFVGDRVYVFGVWRSGFAPLLEEFLSTVELP